MNFEWQTYRHKIRNEFSYALLWIVVVILIFVVPLILNQNLVLIHYICGLASLFAAIYKLRRGINLNKKYTNPKE